MAERSMVIGVERRRDPTAAELRRRMPQEIRQLDSWLKTFVRKILSKWGRVSIAGQDVDDIAGNAWTSSVSQPKFANATDELKIAYLTAAAANQMKNLVRKEEQRTAGLQKNRSKVALARRADASETASFLRWSGPVRNSAIPRTAGLVKQTTHEQIARRAYEIFRSKTCGSEIENWIRTERELRG